ncbi:MAG: ABC transporter permease [Planctomycetes bacterium]|nr:ABC transporter permease [Planctomycetota bacterium]
MASERVRAKLASFAPLYVLIATWLVAAHSTPHFADLAWRDGRLVGASVDACVRAVPVMLAALGLTLVIAGGGIDLSVGSVLALAAVGAARVSEADGSAAAAVAAALGLGLLVGALNGTLVVALGLAPIVATLASMIVVRGAAQLAAGGVVVPIDRSGLVEILAARPAGLPASVLLVGLLFAAFAVAKRRFAFGLYLEASGDNPRAARLAGLPVGAVLFATYVLAGLAAALAGLVVASEIRAADSASAGLYLELDAILAVVIGGTPLSGGRARLLATLVGALALQTLATAMLMHGLAPHIALLVKGVVVLVAAATARPSWGRAIA